MFPKRGYKCFTHISCLSKLTGSREQKFLDRTFSGKNCSLKHCFSIERGHKTHESTKPTTYWKLWFPYSLWNFISEREENGFLCPFFLFMKWKHANITKLCSYILQRFIIRQGCPYPSQRYQDCQHRKNRTLGWKRWRGKYYNFNIMYWYM